MEYLDFPPKCQIYHHDDILYCITFETVFAAIDFPKHGTKLGENWDTNIAELLFLKRKHFTEIWLKVPQSEGHLAKLFRFMVKNSQFSTL